MHMEGMNRHFSDDETQVTKHSTKKMLKSASHQENKAKPGAAVSWPLELKGKEVREQNISEEVEKLG